MNYSNSIYVVINGIESSEKWYNSNITSALIGAISALAGTFIAIYISEKNRKKEERKNIIILITQTHSELFNLIFSSAKSESNVDHTKFRKLIGQFNILYLLPKNLKYDFLKLAKIYEYRGEEFEKVKANVHIECKKIVDTIKRYGADIFE